LGQELDEDEFMLLRMTSKVLKKDNLLVEICTRQDFRVNNFLRTLIIMGDLGAKTLLYFRQLELQIQLKRQIDHAIETSRQIDMGEYQTQLMKDFEAGILNAQMRQEWKLNLEPLVVELEDKAAVEKPYSVSWSEKLGQCKGS
jgi:hypothetical protein